MPNVDRTAEVRTQKRIARKYRTLGYDVIERPDPDHLPDFMRDTAPDLVARSASDNVVVEIKRRAALKGSNDLIGLAERVSDRPDWRFELVVLADEGPARSRDPAALIARSREAMELGLTDVAFLSLMPVLAETIQDVSRRYGARLADASTRRIIDDLAFRGVLPESLLDRCLATFTIWDRLLHDGPSNWRPTRSDFEELAQIVDELRSIT